MILALACIRRYAWFGFFALLIVGGAVLLFVLRQKPVGGLSAAASLKTELAGIRAENEMDRRRAATDSATATQAVNLAYEKQKADLTTDERAEAQTLAADPVALAGLLARAGSRRQHGA